MYIKVVKVDLKIAKENSYENKIIRNDVEFISCSL